jgi:hypothetical protein
MIVTNGVTRLSIVGQWRHTEQSIVVTDEQGNEYVIQPGDGGGLQIMTISGDALLVVPRTTNAIEVRSEP